VTGRSHLFAAVHDKNIFKKIKSPTQIPPPSRAQAKNYTPEYYWFEVLECCRRLILASVVGLVDAESAIAPVLGLIIAMFFIHVFELRPYKDQSDNTLGIILGYCLAFLYLSALMIKMDASGSKSDQDAFAYILMFLLLSGPAAALLMVAAIIRLIFYPPHENDMVDDSQDIENIDPLTKTDELSGALPIAVAEPAGSSTSGTAAAGGSGGGSGGSAFPAKKLAQLPSKMGQKGGAIEMMAPTFSPTAEMSVDLPAPVAPSAVAPSAPAAAAPAAATAAATLTPNFCHQCGSGLVAVSRFCSNCGTLVVALPAKAPVQAAPSRNHGKLLLSTPLGSRL